MEKFIPYEKLSKNKKREQDLKRRGRWNGLNPVIRMPPNPKAYNRQKHGNGTMIPVCAFCVIIRKMQYGAING